MKASDTVCPSGAVEYPTLAGRGARSPPSAPGALREPVRVEVYWLCARVEPGLADLLTPALGNLRQDFRPCRWTSNAPGSHDTLQSPARRAALYSCKAGPPGRATSR